MIRSARSLSPLSKDRNYFGGGMFWFIWKHSWKEQLVVILILIFASMPLGFMKADVTKAFVDQILENPPDDASFYGITIGWHFITLLIVIYVSYRALRLLNTYLTARIRAHVAYKLQALLTRQEGRYTFVKNGAKASVVTVDECANISDFLSKSISELVLQLSIFTTIIVFLTIQSPMMGLFIFAIAMQFALSLPIALAFRRVTERETVAGRRLAGRIAPLASTMTKDAKTARGAFRTVKRLFRTRMKRARLLVLYSLVRNGFPDLVVLSILICFAILISNDQATIGAAIATLAARNELTDPLKRLNFYLIEFFIARGRYRLLQKWLEAPSLPSR